MNNFKPLALVVFLLGALLFASCDGNENELSITTVRYNLLPQGGGAGPAFTLSYTDLDGGGGNDPITNTGNLSGNDWYAGTLEVFNEANGLIEDVTELIKQNANDYQIFYVHDFDGLAIKYEDADENGLPMGLSTTLKRSAPATTGNLTIILIHKPNKSAAGVSDGDITNAGGETKIEATFEIKI